MSQWIDYDLLKMEIGLHRSNAQREIVNYKEKNESFLTSPKEYTRQAFIDRLLYENEVGTEITLSCLERWCDDFKFSGEEVTEIEEQKIKEETVNKAIDWLEDNVFSSEQLDRNYSDKFRKAMEE